MQAEGGKGGSAPAQETAADAGTRRGAQGRAAETGEWGVQTTSRWAAFRTGRGGGERVKNERASTMNGYGWGGGRRQGETNDPENDRRKRWGGRATLKVLR